MHPICTGKRRVASRVMPVRKKIWGKFRGDRPAAIPARARPPARGSGGALTLARAIATTDPGRP